MGYRDEKCDARITITLPRSLKAKVVARSREKRRTISEWTRLVYEDVLGR